MNGRPLPFASSANTPSSSCLFSSAPTVAQRTRTGGPTSTLRPDVPSRLAGPASTTPRSSARSTSGRSASSGIPGVDLMERAGAGLAEVVQRRRADRSRSRSCAARATTAATGSSARGCYAGSAATRACCCSARPTSSAATRGPTTSGSRATPPEPFDPGALDGAAAIVDAILGTGFSGEPRDPAAGAIEAINAAAGRRRCRRRMRRPERRRRLDRRGARRGGPGRHDRHLPRRQAWSLDRSRQGVCRRGRGDRHRDSRGRTRRTRELGLISSRVTRHDPEARQGVDQVRRRQRARVRRLDRPDRCAVHGRPRRRCEPERVM